MTDPRTLADRLDREADMTDSAGQRHRPHADDLRAAAALLRHHAALLDAARQAAREIHASHYQDPLIRTLCVVCGPEDGSYPCTAHMVADDLRRIADAATFPDPAVTDTPKDHQ